MKIDTTMTSCVQSEHQKIIDTKLLNGNSAILAKQQTGGHFENGILVQRKSEEVLQTHEPEDEPIWEAEVDHHADDADDAKKTYKWDIVWVNVILLGGLHLCAVFGLYLRLKSNLAYTLPAYILKFMGFASTIGITGGAHRLWTHRTFEANTALQCLLMFMATLTYQNSVYIWARDHRLHHKCSETDGDPHNAKRGFFFSHVGWLLVRKHPDVIEQGKSIDMSDLQANKIVMFQHKYYYPLVFICVVGLPGFLGWYFDLEWYETVFTVIIYKYILSVNLTWCINSLAHLYGHRPYDKNIGPTESQVMRYLGMGEGFHNYHHTFPWDYKAAEFSNDSRNITTVIIDFFAWVGWAKNRRVAPPELIEKRYARTGGAGREFHMMKDNPDKIFHNIASFLIVFCYVYYI